MWGSRKEHNNWAEPSLRQSQIYGLRLNWKTIDTHAHTTGDLKREICIWSGLDMVRYACIHDSDINGSEPNDSDK